MRNIILSSLMAVSLVFLTSGCSAYTSDSTVSSQKSEKCGAGKCGDGKTKASKCGDSKCGSSKAKTTKCGGGKCGSGK